MASTVSSSGIPALPLASEQESLLSRSKAPTTTETTPATTTIHPRQIRIQPDQGRQGPRRRPGLTTRRSSSMKRQLSTLDIALLTVCMLGVQFTWTVELGYGTPYLLSLGIPKSLTPLVWLAGPLSGLVIQPVVGVFSDSLDWKIGRRRPFIIIGAILTALSMYMVAYAKDLAEMITGDGQGEREGGGGGGGGGVSMDAAHLSAVKAWTIVFAVVGFYCLDFSINAVQACCRSLIMDIPPTDQQEMCNAWSGWMNNLGSVAGFFAGNLNLVKLLPWIGDAQIKILAHLAMIFFVSCLAISCWSVQEVQYFPTEEDKKRSVWSTLGNIWRTFRKLPAEIQRICNVQFFAWMGWFPFLFYATTWVGEIMHRFEHPRPDPGHDHGSINSSSNSLSHRVSNVMASNIFIMSSSGDDPMTASERAGSFALLCWASVAVLCGLVLPRITPQEVGRHRWPRNPFTLRNLWTMSLVWFTVCMGMTWFVDDLWAATMVIALCGVPWAVAMWVPFAMVGEIISDMKDRLESRASSRAASRAASRSASGSNLLQQQHQGGDDGQNRNPNYGTISSATTLGNNDGTGEAHISATTTAHRQEGEAGETSNQGSQNPLLVRVEDDSDDEDDEDVCGLADGQGLTVAELEEERRKQGPHLDAGLVLGVHNMYIVFPQFVDAVVASCLIAMIGSVSHGPITPGPSPPSPSPSPSPLPPHHGHPPHHTMWDPQGAGVGGGYDGVNWMNQVVAMAFNDPEPIGWVLRFGGLMAIVAAYLTRRL